MSDADYFSADTTTADEHTATRAAGRQHQTADPVRAPAWRLVGSQVSDQGDDVQREYTRPRTPRVVIVLELASLALLGWYLYVLLVPDNTQRGLRAWSVASKACYGGAAALGQAGMACERRYLALTAG